MTPPARSWPVRLTAAAEADFSLIVLWSAQQFGSRQAQTYARTLSLALEALSQGPDTVGVQRRDDVARGVLSLHVARGRRKGRHFVIFRVRRDGERPCIEVLRILHDAMNLPRHVASIGEKRR